MNELDLRQQVIGVFNEPDFNTQEADFIKIEIKIPINELAAAASDRMTGYAWARGSEKLKRLYDSDGRISAIYEYIDDPNDPYDASLSTEWITGFFLKIPSNYEHMDEIVGVADEIKQLFIHELNYIRNNPDEFEHLESVEQDSRDMTI